MAEQVGAPARTMTRAEALLWMAGLEEPCHCNACTGSRGNRCNGTGKAPVLPELSEPCPCIRIPGDGRPEDGYNCRSCFRFNMHKPDECNCQGRGWVPKEGETALHAAMQADGWYYSIQQWPDGERVVFFSKWDGHRPLTRYVKNRFEGRDADDWIAAQEALRAAGHV